MQVRYLKKFFRVETLNLGMVIGNDKLIKKDKNNFSAVIAIFRKFDMTTTGLQYFNSSGVFCDR